jgi:hypothetical protein
MRLKGGRGCRAARRYKKMTVVSHKGYIEDLNHASSPEGNEQGFIKQRPDHVFYSF